MDDLISRQATLKELIFWCDVFGYGGLTKDNIREIMNNKTKIPSVEQEMKGESNE